MSPKELRAFRESLGLSRRKFAPMLFVSEPTVVRWERGEGKPREAQLVILRRMRTHLGTEKPGAGFRYDNAGPAVGAEMLQDDRRLIVETLRGMGIVPIEGRQTKDGGEWWVRFGLGWATGPAVEIMLTCEGAESPTRPTIDFSLVATAAWRDRFALPEAVAQIARDHRTCWSIVDKDGGVSAVEFYYRIFRTGCNVDTVKHVVGNFASCWRRVSSIPAAGEGGAPVLDKSDPGRTGGSS